MGKKANVKKDENETNDKPNDDPSTTYTPYERLLRNLGTDSIKESGPDAKDLSIGDFYARKKKRRGKCQLF